MEEKKVRAKLLDCGVGTARGWNPNNFVMDDLCASTAMDIVPHTPIDCDVEQEAAWSESNTQFNTKKSVHVNDAVLEEPYCDLQVGGQQGYSQQLELLEGHARNNGFLKGDITCMRT